MRSVLVLVVALALTNAFNLKTFLSQEIEEIEKYLGGSLSTTSKIPTKCDASANYAITVKQADLSVWPPKQGQEEEITIDVLENEDVTLTKGTAKIKIAFVTIPYDFDIPADFQVLHKGQEIKKTLKEMIPSSPIKLNNNKVTVELKDASGNVHYCGYTTVSLDALSPEEDEMLSAGPQITKCKDVDYEVSLKSFDVSPYPIQKGKPVKFDAIGVSNAKVNVKDLKVEYAGATVADIKVDKECDAGQNCEFTDSEDIPYIPFISSATLTANIYDTDSNDLACYKVKVKFGEEKLDN